MKNIVHLIQSINAGVPKTKCNEYVNYEDVTPYKELATCKECKST